MAGSGAARSDLGGPRSAHLVPWVAGAVIGLLLGLASAASPVAAAGVVLAVAVVFAVLRTSLAAEFGVAAYWAAFCLYETVFSQVSIPGFFYPFYGLFALTAIGTVARTGGRVHLPSLLPYLGFLLVVAISFVGFREPTGFEVMQRLLAYVFGVLILFQFGSRKGFGVVAAGLMATSAVISGWVVVRSYLAGFDYRGDVPVDQNMVAYLIGFGLVAATAFLVDRRVAPGRAASFAVAGVVLLSAYASLLLASRGIVIAVVVAVVIMVAVRALNDRRALGAVVGLAALVAIGFVLPGGEHLVERFEGSDVATANQRLPIWLVTIDAYVTGTLPDMVIGAGFDESKRVVQRRFGSLTSTHNAYLQVLYEFGFVGLVLFLATFAALVVRARSVVAPYGTLVVGTSAFLLAAALSVNIPDGFPFWAALGFMLAIAARGDGPTADDRSRP